MKKFIYSLSLLLSAMAFSGCDDFFDPDSDDQLRGDEYISSDTEMYTGFLGIMTRIQTIGDKEILLTDTRGVYLEPTINATPELISLYNYDADLNGNSYADPAPYYEAIMACNDYLYKMEAYSKQVGVDPERCADLVSWTICFKAWLYKTLVEIYGEAIWFDNPITELTELTPENGFEFLSTEKIIDKALELMTNGWHGFSSSRTIDRDAGWVAWLDNISNLEKSPYRIWNFMILPYEGVYSELLLWKGAALDAKVPDGSASQPYYQKVCDLLLPAIEAAMLERGNPKDNNVYWAVNGNYTGKYKDVFSGTILSNKRHDMISLIPYDYKNNQINSLNDHFLSSERNRYLLRPSEFALNLWSNTEFNPGGNDDTRFSGTFGNVSSANPIIRKFSGSEGRASYADVEIITYRSLQYHFYLIEALNHLHRYVASSTLLNAGIDSNPLFDLESPDWEGFTEHWGNSYLKYPNKGVRGCMGHYAFRPCITNPNESDVTDAEAIRANDMQMLDEALLEFACEGRTYPMMNRMALRYNDLSIVADRVAPKYAESGKDALIRARILDGGNYVHYDLKMSRPTEDAGNADNASDDENTEE